MCPSWDRLLVSVSATFAYIRNSSKSAGDIETHGNILPRRGLWFHVVPFDIDRQPIGRKSALFQQNHHQRDADHLRLFFQSFEIPCEEWAPVKMLKQKVHFEMRAYGGPFSTSRTQGSMTTINPLPARLHKITGHRFFVFFFFFKQKALILPIRASVEMTGENIQAENKERKKKERSWFTKRHRPRGFPCSKTA